MLLTASASGMVAAVGMAFVLAGLGKGTNAALLWSVVIISALAAFARGVVRVAVEADEQRIVVMNIWRTHVVPWATVDSIEDSGMFWPGAAVLLYVFTPLRVRTGDGRKIYVQASTYDFDLVARYLRNSSSHAHRVHWGFRFD